MGESNEDESPSHDGQDRPYVKNADDKKQVKEAREKVKNKRLTEIDDLKFVLSSIQGRRVFWKYLGVCGIFSISFNGDPNRMIFHEGERNVGLRLVKDINEADKEAYPKMMVENR